LGEEINKVISNPVTDQPTILIISFILIIYSSLK